MARMPAPRLLPPPRERVVELGYMLNVMNLHLPRSVTDFYLILTIACASGKYLPSYVLHVIRNAVHTRRFTFVRSDIRLGCPLRNDAVLTRARPTHRFERAIAMF